MRVFLSKLVRSLMRVFLSKLVRKLSKRLSKPVEIDGLWVGAGDGETLVKVRTALKIIEIYDPRRYARILKDLEGIWVNLLPAALGQFASQEDLCELDERFVLRATPDQIASTIVHEAAHARLWHRGIHYPEEIRLRVEMVCLRQQQVFASKLPAPETIVGEVDRHLGLSKVDDWSDQSLERSYVRGSVVLLRDMQMPRWLIAFFLRRRRAQRRRLRRMASASEVRRPTAIP